MIRKGKILRFSKPFEAEPLANMLGLYASILKSEEDKDFGFISSVLPVVVHSLSIFSLEQQSKVFNFLEQLLDANIGGLEKLFSETGMNPKDIIAGIVQGIQSCEKEHPYVPELLQHICKIITILNKGLIEGNQVLNMETLTNRLIELAYLKCQEYRLRIEAPVIHVHEFEYEMFQQLGQLLDNCSKFVTKNVSEELLYSLLASNIESLQKAGYHMLKNIYITSLPALQFPSEDKWDITADTEKGVGEELKGNLEKTKYDDLNKNIPLVLIEMIEKIPNISSSHVDTLKEARRTAASVESIITHAEAMDEENQEESKEGENYVLTQEMYGYLLCWNSLLHKVYYGWLHSRKAKNDDYLAVLNSISVHLSNNKENYEMFLIYLTAYLPSSEKFASTLKEEDIINFDPAIINLQGSKDIEHLAIFCLFNFMKNYPSLATNFYSRCDPVIGKLITNIVTKIISPTIWFAEASNLHNCQVKYF